MFLLDEKQWIITKLNLSGLWTGFGFTITSEPKPACKPPPSDSDFFGIGEGL